MHRRHCVSQLISPHTPCLLLMEPPDCFGDNTTQTNRTILCIRCRPCRERMMTVLAVVNHSAGSSAAHNHSSSSMAGACPGGAGPGAGNGSCTAGACGGTRHCGGQAQLFDTFLEEDVNVAQLAAYLCAAGLLQHWAAATGLPPPS